MCTCGLVNHWDQEHPAHLTLQEPTSTGASPWQQDTLKAKSPLANQSPVHCTGFPFKIKFPLLCVGSRFFHWTILAVTIPITYDMTCHPS